MDMEDLITRLQVLNKTALKYDVKFLELLIEITQSELTELLHYKEYNSAWDLLVLQIPFHFRVFLKTILIFIVQVLLNRYSQKGG